MKQRIQSLTFQPIDVSNDFEVEEAYHMILGIIQANEDSPERFENKWRSEYKSLANFFASLPTCFVLINGAYAGLFIYNLSNDDLAQDEGCLDSFFLRPQYRGLGFGRQTMKEIEKIIFEAGKKKLTLQTKLGHERNEHIYAALGFTCLGPKQARPDRVAWVKFLGEGN